MLVASVAPQPATGRRCQSQAEQDEAVSWVSFRHGGFTSPNSRGALMYLPVPDGRDTTIVSQSRREYKPSSTYVSNMRLLLHRRGCGRTTISCKSHIRWHKGVGNLLPSPGCTIPTEGGKSLRRA